MVAKPRSLTDALLEWVAGRLVLVDTSDAPPPRWPPTDECRRSLEAGRIAEALALPDADWSRYRIIDHLRRDAPHLLLARDEDLQRDVVIKLIRAPNHFARVAAAREARLTAALAHPNIVVIHEVDVDGAYLVVEHLDADLRDLAGLPSELLIDAYCQAGRALAAAHRHGIWHLDFKPENVLARLEEDGAGRTTRLWAKLTDFGIAQVAGPVDELVPAALAGAGRTTSGAFEDQRAFATAVWETLTRGRVPPDGGELLPYELHAVLQRALMPEPSQRWADMTALVDAIERGRAGTAAVSSRERSRSGPIRWAVAQAQDGLFASVAHLWADAKASLEERPERLGEGGVSLGFALLRAAEVAPTEDSKRRGFEESLAVLVDAVRFLEGTGQRDQAEFASSHARVAARRLAELLPHESPRRRALEEWVRAEHHKFLTDEDEPTARGEKHR